MRELHLLVLEQIPLALEGRLEDLAPSAGSIRCVRREWSESVPLSAEPVDLIVPVTSAQEAEARRLLTWLGRQRPRTPTLAIVPKEASAALLRAASEAVDDFVLGPASGPELRQRMARILGDPDPELAQVRSRLIEEIGLTALVGSDPAFVTTIEMIPRVARSEGTVLITGETGTGKELCARAIHHFSARRSFPFIAVDCGAFPEHLLENELFGHARGAYTDAHGDQRGLTALAEGGTLFLDEIDSLSLAAQSKLLRFLQDRAYKPLGSEKVARANVRIVVATNRDLEARVEERNFRADLFFRLDVFRLRMPPLRERPGDIPILARHFLETLGQAPGAVRRVFSPPALRQLALHHWPGNVRELFNVVQRAYTFSDGPQIPPNHISFAVRAADAARPASFQQARARAIQEFENAYIQELLYKHHGNITQAAREAHKDRRAFGRLVKKHGVARPTSS